MKICSGIRCNVSELQKHNEDNSSYINLSDSSSDNRVKVTDLCSEKERSCPSTISDNLMEIVDSLETENYVTKYELEIHDVNSLCYCLKIDFKSYMYNYLYEINSLVEFKV